MNLVYLEVKTSFRVPDLLLAARATCRKRPVQSRATTLSFPQRGCVARACARISGVRVSSESVVRRWFPTGKIVFVAPSRPLVLQQKKGVIEHVGIPEQDAVEMVGSIVKGPQRKPIWEEKRVFFCTPEARLCSLRHARLAQCPCLSPACFFATPN